MSVSPQLLSDTKNYLDITWDDPDGDRKLSGIIARGMAYLDRVAGASLDYDAEDKPRELLFDYVRYVRANALPDYQDNLVHELLSLQIEREAGRYGSDTSSI